MFLLGFLAGAAVATVAGYGFLLWLFKGVWG